MSDSTNIQLRQRAGCLTIEFADSDWIMEPEQANELSSAIWEAVSTHPERTVIVDLKQIKYVDTAAYGLFVQMNSALRDEGRKFVLAGLHENVAKSLGIMQLDKILTIVDSADDVE